jgi:hypothetical protein
MSLVVRYQPSRAGDRALDAALVQARESGAALTVTYLLPESVSRSCCSISTDRWRSILEDVARDALARARARVDEAGVEGTDYVVVVPRRFRRGV